MCNENDTTQLNASRQNKQTKFKDINRFVAFDQESTKYDTNLL